MLLPKLSETWLSSEDTAALQFSLSSMELVITSSHSAVARTFSCPMFWRFKPHFLVSTTFISYYLRHLLLSEDLCISFHPLHPSLVKQPSPRPQLPNPLTSGELDLLSASTILLPWSWQSSNDHRTPYHLELFTYGFLFQISLSLLNFPTCHSLIQFILLNLFFRFSSSPSLAYRLPLTFLFLPSIFSRVHYFI